MTIRSFIDKVIYNLEPDLDKLVESPVEKLFWQAAKRRIPGLKPQVKVGYWRLDFGIPEQRIGIEIDGHEFHSSPADRRRDVIRERKLLEQGWLLFRFTGSEIYEDPDRCAIEAERLVRKVAKLWRN